MRARTARYSMHRSGFTLIESLVVAGLIAVLMSLVLPALFSARSNSRATTSLANLRTLGQTLAIYEEVQQTYPFGRWGWANPPETGFNVSFGFLSWSIDRAWPVLMHDVAPWPEHARAWVSPGAADPNRFAKTWTDPISTFTTDLASYRYSYAFIASGSLWDGRTEADESLIRPQRAANVVFPSGKVLMFDGERAYLRAEHADSPARPVLMADVSAGIRSDRDAQEPVRNPLRIQPPKLYHDTPNGIGGRDF